MKKFDLDTWLKNKSRKIVTRTGKPVRIVCWDSPNKAFPIIGFIDNEPEIFVWDCFGYCCEGHIETEFDLFFADEEEEELTVFNDEYFYDFTFELIQNNKKQLGLDDNYIGAPKVIHDLCMICCQYGYNKAKEETK